MRIGRENRNNWARARVCSACGKVEEVRRDNVSARCKSCASRASGAKGGATMRARAAARPKDQKPGRPVRVERVCVCCEKVFSVPPSRLSGKTNATARYCSRGCYNSMLRGTGLRHKNGAIWARISRKVRAASPFCGWCGTTKHLQVHHIVPERRTQDDSEVNLIPLCPQHHRWLETMTAQIEHATGGGDFLEAIAPFSALLRYRQSMTRAYLTRFVCQ
jgi:5-methylcytosine-specific restriction endonuclease McrA